jgi:carbamoyl-phosphate synthase large subunit
VSWRYQPYRYYESLARPVPVNLFVRQGFTESSEKTREKLQLALDAIATQGGSAGVNIITGRTAQSGDTFKTNFQQETGLEFTPDSFRKHRLNLLQEADGMVILRTGLSESTAFEVAVNVCGGNSLPVFYAIEPGCEIKTTLLRELTGFNDAKVTYKVIAGGIQNIREDKEFQAFMHDLRTKK